MLKEESKSNPTVNKEINTMFPELEGRSLDPYSPESYAQLRILNTPVTEVNNSEVEKGNLLNVIVILGCILDYIWK